MDIQVQRHKTGRGEIGRESRSNGTQNGRELWQRHRYIAYKVQSGAPRAGNLAKGEGGGSGSRQCDAIGTAEQAIRLPGISHFRDRPLRYGMDAFNEWV